MKTIRHKLIQYLVKNLLRAITTDEILTISNREVLLKRRKLTPEEIIDLKTEARSFEKSLTWRLMKNDITYATNVRMFDKSKHIDDMIFGKAMLYSLSLIEMYIENLKSL